MRASLILKFAIAVLPIAVCSAQTPKGNDSNFLEDFQFCGVASDTTEGVVDRVTLTGPEEYILKTNIKVHYTRAGDDSVDQTYAQFVADVAQGCRDVQCGTFGWRVPPSDGSVGGDSRYDIYIRLLDATGGVLGITYAESLKVLPNGYSSYIVISCGLV